MMISQIMVSNNGITDDGIANDITYDDITNDITDDDITNDGIK